MNPKEVIKSLNSGKIDGNDIDGQGNVEILLKGILSVNENLRNEYTIIPANQPPLNREQFGIVVYESSLLAKVNKWVNDEGKDFIKQKEAKLDKEINPPDTSNTIWLFSFVPIILIGLFFGIKKAFKNLFNKTKTQELISKSKEGEETGIKPPENNNNSQDSMNNSNSGENTKRNQLVLNHTININQHQNHEEEKSMSGDKYINVGGDNKGIISGEDNKGDVTNNYTKNG